MILANDCLLCRTLRTGYDNTRQFWHARNSWGSNWADGGNFRQGISLDCSQQQRACMHGSAWQL